MITLLATDLDGTLVGDDTALLQLNSQLTRLRISGQLKLAYVTGRSLEMYSELQKEKDLLQPDALIAAVGSEIYIDQVRQGDWPKVSQWDVKHISEVLSSYPDIRPQPPTEQRDYKLCYYYDDGNDSIAKIQMELGQEYTAIYSSNRYLDILPTGVDKASAIKQLCSYWGLPDKAVIAAGDSGNDIAMLTNYRGIIVGNASAELLAWQLTCANKHLFMTSANQAGGIFEGLQYFGIINNESSNSQ